MFINAMAQFVECLHDKQKACVRILARVKYFVCSFAFFLLCYPGEALECPILTQVCII